MHLFMFICWRLGENNSNSSLIKRITLAWGRHIVEEINEGFHQNVNRCESRSFSQVLSEQLFESWVSKENVITINTVKFLLCISFRHFWSNCSTLFCVDLWGWRKEHQEDSLVSTLLAVSYTFLWTLLNFKFSSHLFTMFNSASQARPVHLASFSGKVMKIVLGDT